MRRTGFKPKYERREAKRMDDYTARPRPIAAAAATIEPRPVVSVPKHDYVRSEALLVACRSIECQHCGAADGTVCAAHSNWGAHAKGGGIKADDNRVASLCSACHHQLDQGLLWTEDVKQTVWWLAHCKTVARLLLDRLWPAGVPVPDTTFAPAYFAVCN